MGEGGRPSGCQGHKPFVEKRTIRLEGRADLRGSVTKRLRRICALLLVTVVTWGCAAGQAFRRGDEAMKNGDLDQAVANFRAAVQADPDNPQYKISLERAMQAASRFHLDRAHQFEQQEQLEAALGEYKLAAEYDPTNRQIAGKVASLERTLRDRLEAARPRPAGQQLRERARAASPEPMLNPGSREPLVINFVNTNFKDILNFVGNYAGINVSYDREVVDRPSTVQLSGVTLEQALTQIMTMNQLSYKVVNEKSIFVFQDTVQKHTQYDEQVIKTFYVQHADATELVQLLSQIIRLPNMAIQPAIAPNRTNNTITIRASTSVMQILEKLIEQHDKPRAEIVFDIEILEVDRERAKSYGLDLTQFAVGALFSPEVSPTGGATTPPPANGNGAGAGGGATVAGGQSTAPNAVTSPPPFNLNTITRGFRYKRLLSRRTGSRGPISRERHPHQGIGQAAASWHRRVQGHGESGNRSPDRHDELHTDCHWWRGRQSPQLVQPQASGNQHRHYPAGDA